jgi:hypothetical protein
VQLAVAPYLVISGQPAQVVDRDQLEQPRPPLDIAEPATVGVAPAERHAQDASQSRRLALGLILAAAEQRPANREG